MNETVSPAHAPPVRLRWLWLARRVRAIAYVGVFFSLGTASAARAAEDAGVADAPQPVHHFAIDASVDATSRRGASGAASVTAAPFGDLDVSGLRVLAQGDLSLYRYTNGSPPPGMINGRTTEGGGLVGYEYDTDALTIAGYAGFNRRTTTANAIDPRNTTLGTRAGGAFRVEGSFTPDDRTTLEAAVDYNTPNQSWRIDAKASTRIAGALALGPQIIMQGDTFYRQIGAGAHLQGFTFCGLAFGLGMGLLMDAREGPGLYASVETERRF